jgi:colanic acid biosynthesis glycosyl transferase WcaI
VISQVYVPDPASVGQHLADAAEDMAAQGWNVSVLTSDRGYEDPRLRFARSETRNGVSIRRLGFSSLGKRTLVHRLVGQLSFCLQVVAYVLWTGKPDLILITTSPPMATLVGTLLHKLRGTPIAFWVMDINPDQAIAAGQARPGGALVRLFDFFNRQVLRHARVVIALDRYMAETLQRKVGGAGANIVTLPPWPHESHLERVEHRENPFRRAHDLADKFVVMYSGNHSPVHSLTTLLHAAEHLAGERELVFMFIGGGLGKREVEEFVRTRSLPNVRILPYQPLDQIKYSLSAADLHVVSMGPSMVGIIHPCKFYGAMALAKPILYFGPAESHIGEVIASTRCGWRVEHGDVDGTVELLRSVSADSPDELIAAGARGRRAIDSVLGEEALRSRFAALLAEAAGLAAPGTSRAKAEVPGVAWS